METTEIEKALDNLKVKYIGHKPTDNKIHLFLGNIKLASYYFDEKMSVRMSRKSYVVEPNFPTKCSKYIYETEEECRDKFEELVKLYKNKLLRKE